MNQENKPWNKGLTKETDERIRKYSIKIRKNRKGKCMGDKSPTKRQEVRLKISKKLKNRVITKEWKEKISKSLTGHIQSKETKRRRKESLNRPEVKEKNRKAKIGNTYKKGKKVKDTSKMKGHSGVYKRTKEHKRKLKKTEAQKQKCREAAFDYAKRVSNIICPRIGKNEKKILDKLEQTLNYKIDRKFTIKGFFPDGYVHELNLIIEVDERPKNREKDIEREKIIKKTLNCKFLRIKDYD